MVTHRCNARCIMCKLWRDSKNDIPIKVYTDLIRQPLFRDIVNVAVTGGELTLRTDLVDLFQSLFEHCSKLESINLSSNAFLPDRLLDIVTELVDTRNSIGSDQKIIVQISLDGPGKIHDEVRGVPGGFEKVKEAARKLESKFQSDNVEIHHLCLLQPANIEFLDEVTSYFHSIKNPVTYNIVCDATYLETDSATHPVLTPQMKSRLEQFFHEMIRNKSSDPMHRHHYLELVQWLKNGYREKSCGLLTQHILVDHRGQILPCMNSGEEKYPCIEEAGSLDLLWRSRKRWKINRRLKNTRCPKCMIACGHNTFDLMVAYVRHNLTTGDRH